jgi:CopG family nickel-responsive transcriptional regulator
MLPTLPLPMSKKPKKDNASRISITLPQTLSAELGQIVISRGYASRSDAICKMLSEQLVQHQQQFGRQIMAGTISLVYDNAKNGLQNQLMMIQRKYVKEIISSQHVFLVNHQSLEVLLVQGPGSTLERIANELITCRGVRHGYLNVTTAILPPIH